AGEDAPHAPLVEMRKRKGAALHLALNEGGDEIARDDEEHVNADETAAPSRHAIMEQHHRQNGERAQPINLGAVGCGGGEAAHVMHSYPSLIGFVPNRSPVPG